MRELAKYEDASGREVTLTDVDIKRVICDNPNVTDKEMKLFVELCKAQRLNPFVKEAYLVKYGGNPATMVVGKDVYTKRAQANPRFKGLQAGVFVVDGNGKGKEREGSMVLPGETPVGAWCKVYVDGYDVPIYDSVSFDEYAGKKRDGSLNSTWAGKPGTMIRKVAATRRRTRGGSRGDRRRAHGRQEAGRRRHARLLRAQRGRLRGRGRGVQGADGAPRRGPVVVRGAGQLLRGELMDAIDLWDALMEDRRLMKAAVNEASARGKVYAVKKADYYSKKSAAALRMKADGLPVTLIDAAVKGVDEVASAMLEMQCAEAEWRAAMKAVDVYREDCRIVYDQIKRAQAGDPDYL